MDINYKKVDDQTSGFWSERVYVVTNDYEISGYIFMPKTVKKNRILSDILNGTKRFIAIKDAIMTNKKHPSEEKECHDFIQINLDKIELVRPFKQGMDFEK